MNRRILVLGALVLLVAMLLLMPRPAAMERFVADLDDGSADAPRLLVGRAKYAAARYEPENDTTILAFDCGHFGCETALRVEGDARDLVGRSHVLLRPSADAYVREALEPPLESTWRPPPGVQAAAQPAFRALPFWPIALATPIGLVAAIATGAWAWRGRDAAMGLGLAAAAGAGVAIAGLRALGGDAILFLWILAFFATVLALMSLAFFRARRWPRVLAAFALTMAALVAWMGPWFPSAPSL